MALWLITASFAMAGCRAVDTAPEATPGLVLPAVAAAPTLPPPPLHGPASAPGAPLPATLTPRPTATNHPVTVLSAPAVEQGEAVPSPTPAPTFTRPPQEAAPAGDHYWLNRPVPEGAAVWTNKAYPYGSTRGGTLRPHHGVEFDVPAGTPVLAAAAGTVRFAGTDVAQLVGPEANFYGNVVVIEHGFLQADKPVFSLYAHLSEILVVEGQSVAAVEMLARSGASGVADGAHLHFEVRVDANEYGATRNPLLWLYPFPDRGVVAGRVIWPDGTLAPEVPVTLRRLDAPSPYAATTTYAVGKLNADEQWRENVAFDDVSAGYYELAAGSGPDRVAVELWVYPTQTNAFELVLKP